MKREIKNFQNLKSNQKKHFSSETGHFFTDDSFEIPLEDMSEKFDKCWSELELFFGKLSYLAVGDVFVGKNGVIYKTEEEVIVACKQDNGSAEKKDEMVNIDLEDEAVEGNAKATEKDGAGLGVSQVCVEVFDAKAQRV